jgi:hypothetical protein
MAQERITVRKATMIQLTEAEMATYAHVEETYPCRRAYLALGRRYDAIWEHSRSSDLRGRRQEIAQLCLRMAEISAGRGDQYRLAMWQRRAYLHLVGCEERVYSAADALRWEREMRRLLDGGSGKPGSTLPAAHRRILGTVLGLGDTEVPGQGVARFTPLREGPIEGAA